MLLRESPLTFFHPRFNKQLPIFQANSKADRAFFAMSGIFSIYSPMFLLPKPFKQKWEDVILVMQPVMKWTQLNLHVRNLVLPPGDVGELTICTRCKPPSQ